MNRHGPRPQRGCPTGFTMSKEIYRYCGPKVQY